jgi:hypothetical protein
VTTEPDSDIRDTVPDDVPWEDSDWLLYLHTDFYSDTYFPAFPEIIESEAELADDDLLSQR